MKQVKIEGKHARVYKNRECEKTKETYLWQNWNFILHIKLRDLYQEHI